MLKNFEDSVTPSYSDNKFVSHFYNKFNSDIPEDLKKKMQRGVPQEMTSLDIDDTQVKCKPHIQGWI